MMKKNNMSPDVIDMTYFEFLQTVKVLKMLYGRDIAEKFFTKNITEVYNITNASLIKVKD